MNNEVDGINVLNVNGSKDEKISGIIQNMDDPLEALKASSLFNLMFYNYSFNKLSQVSVEIGFKM